MERVLDCGCKEKLLGGTWERGEYSLIEECDFHANDRATKAQAHYKQQRIQEIDAELRELDLKLIRPLAEGETQKVQDLVAEKLPLRSERSSLIGE